MLSQIERELVLVVDYLPRSPIKVSLSRRRNIKDILKDAVDILPDPIVQHTEISSPRNKKKGVGPRKKLRVTFPDGTIIQENEAWFSVTPERRKCWLNITLIIKITITSPALSLSLQPILTPQAHIEIPEQPPIFLNKPDSILFPKHAD